MFWSTTVDSNNTATASHYGAPLVTPSNTVIVPTVMSGNGYSIKVFEGGTGRLKYILTNDYVRASGSSSWRPVYQPVLVTLPSATRLYYPGLGGTVYYVENPDSDTPSAPVQLCFYTNLTYYLSNAASFSNRVFISTPLTANTNGDTFFGFKANGTVPPPMNTNRSGFARIDVNGNGSYVFAANAAGTTSATGSPLSCAPALSNDGSTVYVVSYGMFLLGLDSQTLVTKYVRQMSSNFGSLSDGATASPAVGPDGDVYMGVNNYLFHFSADLGTTKVPGFFGWDHTPSIVPASLVPSYNGSSAYLLFSKYNDYSTRNRIAVLDPNAPQTAPSISGPRMREVLTAFGGTPYSSGPSTEWCINVAAVNPVSSSVLAPSEDGRLYRWNLAANCFSEVITLTGGFFEPYVPTVVGPDGVVYTINGNILFAIGQRTNLDVTISSSAPDLTSVLPLQPITFTATVTNLNPSDPVPTGTVTFMDETFVPTITRITNTLATDVPLSNFVASVTVSTLSSNMGNHFITAIYNGDTNYPATRITMLQKVHMRASITAVTSAIPVPGSNTVTLTAVVTSDPPSGTTRTGMVSFWDGTNFLAQAGLNSPGLCTVVITNFSSGTHAITARYFSDVVHAASSGSITGVPTALTKTEMLADGSFRLGFTNISGAPFTVLGSSELLAPLNTWAVLGQAIEVLPGQFQFTDPQVVNGNRARFYTVRSP